MVMRRIIAVPSWMPSSQSPDYAWETWRKPSGSDGFLWLRDSLPQYAPRSRIYLYEYEFKASIDEFKDLAIAFLETVKTLQEETKNRPILLLAHSAGGLVIKQALVTSSWKKRYAAIRERIKGIAFFATPRTYDADDYSSPELTVILCKIEHGKDYTDDLSKTFRGGSEFRSILDENWRKKLVDCPIVSFWGTSDSVGSPYCPVKVRADSILMSDCPREEFAAWTLRGCFKYGQIECGP
jgi:hypothetical protein